MIIAITGHRPDKLPDAETGWTIPNPTYIKVCKELKRVLSEQKPDKIICGMSMGTDQYAANIANILGIPFIAAVPFVGQERLWQEQDQKRYRKLLTQAAEVKIVSPGGYSIDKMHARNDWMVMNCDKVLAVWDGSKGGTASCLHFAKMMRKEIIRIDPKKL